MKNKEIYAIKCRKCGKIIKSLSENQFNYNLKQHREMHQRQGEKK